MFSLLITLLRAIFVLVIKPSTRPHAIKAAYSAMPSAWPLSLSRGRSQKADILLDTTCFSSVDLDNLSDFNSESDTDTDPDVDSQLPFFDLGDPTNMTKKSIQNAETHAEISRRKALSNSALDTEACYNHPTFPHFLPLFCNLTVSRNT